MNLLRKRGRARRAVAGILAALILFVMLFTVGTGYFLFVNQNDLLYNQALSARTATAQRQLLENLQISPAVAANGHLVFTVVNEGGVSANLTDLLVSTPSAASPSNTVCAYGIGVGLPVSGCPPTTCSFDGKSIISTSPCLPLSLSPGVASPSMDTGLVASSTGTYVIKAVLQDGGSFSATYPPTATTLAAQALSSGAIGDLYLNFGSYVYYTLESGGNCPPNPPSDWSNYCLSSTSGQSAFTIPVDVTNQPLAFSVEVTNLNPNQANIILDPYSLIVQLSLHGTNTGQLPWYIVSNSSTFLLQHYTPVTLSYNQPVVLVFSSANAICRPGYSPGGKGGCLLFGSSATLQQPNGGGSSQLTTGTEVGMFIVSHGCKGLGISSCSVSSANYGQNSPYVTTLYY